MTEVSCANCGKVFEVADDDPAWSITTAIDDSGVERITSRFIEPPCPLCGKSARWMPPGTADTGTGTVTGIVDELGNEMVVNRVEVSLDAPYDPALDAAENIAASA